MSNIDFSFEFAKWKKDQLEKQLGKEPDNEFIKGQIKIWQDICVLTCTPDHEWEPVKNNINMRQCKFCYLIEKQDEIDNEYDLTNEYFQSCDNCMFTDWNEENEKLLCNYQNNEIVEDELEGYLDENGMDCPYWQGKMED